MKEEPTIKLHNMDCMDALREMDDNQFDLAIVDPPYGSKNIKGGYSSGNGGGKGAAKQKDYNRAVWEHGAPGSDYFEELRRVSNNQIMWGANHYIDNLPFRCNSACWLIWDKKNENTGFADVELAWTSFNKAARKFEFMWNGMLQGDMKNKEHRIHPTQKPEALYKWLLQNYAKEGDTILDTHLGSGSIAIACWVLGFDLTGYELDKDYYDAACNRFANFKKQGLLFR